MQDFEYHRPKSIAAAVEAALDCPLVVKGEDGTWRDVPEAPGPHLDSREDGVKVRRGSVCVRAPSTPPSRCRSVVRGR